MTEKEKMLAGEVYSAIDPELIEELMATREVLYEYNSLRPSQTQLFYRSECQHLHSLPQHRSCGTQQPQRMGRTCKHRQ